MNQNVSVVVAFAGLETQNNQKHASNVSTIHSRSRGGTHATYRVVRPCSSSRVEFCIGHCTSTAIKCNQRDHKQHIESPMQTLWKCSIVEQPNSWITATPSSAPYKWWWWCFFCVFQIAAAFTLYFLGGHGHICGELAHIETQQF